MSQPRRLHTVSLRRRVIVAGVLVIAAVLLLLGVATDLLFAAQSRRDTDSVLRARAQLAEQLTARRAAPRELVRRIEASGSVTVRLTLASGEQFGNATPPEELPAARPRNGLSRVGATTVLDRRLPNGAQLLLVADGGQVTAAQQRLRRLLMIVGLGALVVAAAALVGVTRVALAPLDAMTAVARSIARGDRGRRLSPSRPDTELGRAATAFDNMLDALEGAEATARHAEATARASEGRTRQFVADAAHELRTPIAGVQAAAEAVLQSSGSREERERLQLLLVREARRAGLLVEDLLALARIDAGLELQRVPVDLVPLARAEAERTRLLAPSLAVSLDVTGAPVPALADPERIAQVLSNLLDNARRHTPDGGTITIAVATIRDAHGWPWALLSVIDSGSGVPPADRERIFDRLVRLDAARTADSGGAGLGLAIARGIARAHGGDLRCVDPPPGSGGAQFLLTLPVPTSR